MRALSTCPHDTGSVVGTSTANACTPAEKSRIITELQVAHRTLSYQQSDTIVVDVTLMVKIGRNQLCPCGSGKKYKRCCLSTDRASPVDTATAAQKGTFYSAPPGSGFVLVEDEIDKLSNSVVDLIDEGRLEEAEVACQELKAQYPETIDWIHRTAMVLEARGQTQQAITHYEQVLRFMDENPDNFDALSREPFCRDIKRLRQISNTSP